MNALTISGLVKEYAGFRLEIPRLELPEGCIMGLIGENGAGKSTTLRLILNDLSRQSGSIEVLGCDNTSGGFMRVKEELGVVLDESGFPEVLTARQVNAVMKRTYRSWQQDEYFALLRRFDLPENKPFKDYSRGMRMKQAIAVALAHKPRLLLLDEATGGLDPIVRDEILGIFSDFAREADHSVLISSHIVSDLDKLCDTVALLHRGRLMLTASRDEIGDRFALVRCTRAEFGRMERRTVVGMRDTGYGVEALVERALAPAGLTLERPGMEDVMLFMAKGEDER